YQSKGEKTGLRAKQLVNHLDSIFRYHKIRIALVKVETWTTRDLFTVGRNASKALINFLEYKKKNLDIHKGKHFDNVQLITGMDFDGTTVGYARIQTICGSRSAAVVQ
ncbi:disintegrin and metallo ase domain-containing 8, partial [Paramuricea clavata]